GHYGGEPRIGALTHFDVLGDDGHGVVGGNANEGVRLELHLAHDFASGPHAVRGFGCGECRRQVDSERESRCALKEAAAACVFDADVGHVGSPYASAFAASWIAARI